MKNSAKASPLLIENANVITPTEVLQDRHLLVHDGVILALSQSPEEIRKLIIEVSGATSPRIFDAAGCYLAPGFIDLHTNGGGGVEAYDEDLAPWQEFLAKNGVTAFLPTLITRPYDEMVEAAGRVAGMSKVPSKPRILGVYPEGPFINGRYGQQPAENCLAPGEHDFERLLAAVDGTRAVVTVAPELPGANELIIRLVDNGHIASIGHSGASAEETRKAIDLGASLASHLGDAMAFCRPRTADTREGKFAGTVAPQTMEVLLTQDEVYAEVIIDQVGEHLDPIILEIIRRCKPVDRLITVSDNMASAGMPDGRYETVDGRAYVIDRKKDDLIRLEPEGTLAGVVYALKDGIRNLMDQTEASLPEAVASITINPARLLGIDDTLGSIEIGKKADIAILDGDWNVVLTLVDGETVFEAPTKAR